MVIQLEPLDENKKLELKIILLKALQKDATIDEIVEELCNFKQDIHIKIGDKIILIASSNCEIDLIKKGIRENVEEYIEAFYA